MDVFYIIVVGSTMVQIARAINTGLVFMEKCKKCHRLYQSFLRSDVYEIIYCGEKEDEDGFVVIDK